MQHRANRNAPGRHRRTTPLHSHRAPTTPVTEKSRYVVAAALVAGVGVAGVTAVTTSASSATAATTHPAAAKTALAPLVPPAPTVPTLPPFASLSQPPTASSAPALAPSPAAPLAAALARSGSAAAAQAGIGAVPAGSTDGLSFVPQVRKAKPLPLWVNPLPEATTTSCFGPRWGRLHAGVDLAAPYGTRVRAAGAGIVVAAGPAEGYGNAVLIDHQNGYLTHYGHLSAITVTLGQQVAVGDPIGNEGSTGHSTGPHLHFEVHQGTYQNPIEPTTWMHAHGVDITGCTPPAE